MTTNKRYRWKGIGEDIVGGERGINVDVSYFGMIILDGRPRVIHKAIFRDCELYVFVDKTGVFQVNHFN